MSRSTLMIASAVIVLILAIYGYSRYTAIFPSTDDAYIQANVVQMAAQITGPVAAVNVQDHQLVKAGTLLFTIDPQPFQIAVQRAQAQLTQAQSTLATQDKDTVRIMKLVQEGQLPKAEGDDAQGKSTQLTAALKATQAQLAQANLNLQYTQIFAPAAGYVTQFTLRKGQMVQAGMPLFALVENQQWWAEANFKETDLERIHIGQSAKIDIDIYPDVVFKGKIQGISAGSGAAFALLPPENATGNWVKVTQRFPVRVTIVDPDPRYPLRVGASATVTVDTRAR